MWLQYGTSDAFYVGADRHRNRKSLPKLIDGDEKVPVIPAKAGIQ